MRTILLVSFAAMFGGAAVFFALRAFEQSPSEFELAPLVAELEGKMDERLAQWQARLRRDADQPSTDAANAHDVDDPEPKSAEPIAVEATDDVTAWDDGSREAALDTEPTVADERQRPDYPRIGEGLAEAAAALEQFNNALRNPDRADDR